MRKPTIAIKKTAVDYEGLIRLGNAVIESLTGNGLYVTPIPTIASLQAAVTSAEHALALWGNRLNHGSTAELTDLRLKSILLRNLLIAMGQYVESTALLVCGMDYAAMTAMIDSSGFERKGDNSPRGTLQAVRNLRSVISRNLFRNQVKLDWDRPENSRAAENVGCYNVFRANSRDFSTAVQISTVTRSLYIDTNNTHAPVTWSYWIVPVNAAGPGVLSNALTVTVLGA